MNNKELIEVAATKLNRHIDKNGRVQSDVSAAVISKNGKLYTGVCVDVPSWGLCAERSALAAMVTDGEFKFTKIVAVWQDGDTQKLHVLPPCGHCRQFMRDLSENNMEAEVVLDLHHAERLANLIPYHKWPEPLDL